MSAFQEGTPTLQIGFPPLTPMVRRLLIANVAVFFGVFVVGLVSLGLQARLLDLFAVDPGRWRDWAPLVPVWQLVTYGFLHDFSGLGHLFFNMLSLYLFGGMLEGLIGGRRFLTFYLTALTLSGLVHVLVMPLFGWYVPAIGASGACLGVTVATAVLRPNTVVYLLVFPVKLKVVAAVLVAFDTFQMLVQLQGGPASKTATYVHLAGALYGFLAARRGWLSFDPISLFERKRAVAAEERRVSDDVRMDQLLARIKRDGMGTLSSSDREFLRRQSERGR